MKAPSLVASLFVMCFSLSLQAAPRDNEWKKVAEARDQGLPRSAIEALDPIIQAALKDKAWGEAARAIAEKVSFEASVEGNKPEERITRLEASLPKLPVEVRPILQALVAEWYWQYFQRNRWRFLQRTQTAEGEGKDLATWSLPRLFREIDARFRVALAQAPALQRTPIAEFKDLLTPTTVPDRYRPTLFDFIGQQALQFYTSGEQAAAQPENAFLLDASSPIFGPVDAFLAWKPLGTGVAAPDEPVALPVRAIGLYQELLRFHQGDADRGAFLALDLERLVYGHNTAVGEGKDERYLAALQRFVGTCDDDPIATRGLYEWALLLRQQDKLAEAHAVATRGARMHPDSVGAALCHNFIQELEAPLVTLASEQVWSTPRPEIQVRYRSLTNVWFRLVPVDWEKLCREGGPFLSDERQRELLQQPAVAAWSHPLPPTDDFRERTVSFTAPLDLKPGGYFLFASHRSDFLPATNALSAMNVWVSDLGVVYRFGQSQQGGLAVDARSGEPLAGVTVELWHQGDGGAWITSAQATSIDTGLFEFPKREGSPVWPVLLRARRGADQMVMSLNGWPQGHRGQSANQEQTFFFTDRAIYRPGQSVQFKGLCFLADTSRNRYDVLPGREVTVAFRDPNGKEIARQTLRANDYGSFAGSFLTPRDRLMGRLSLAVVTGPRGQGWIQVEEYKRPKFQVALDAPKEGARLGEPVKVTGRALAYTGAAIDGAKVSYRVVREVRWPRWWWWGPPAAPSQLITHGSQTTRTDGSFEITFDAIPDRSIAESDEPTFEFSIQADVTDNAGETRSDQRLVRAGYTALQAEVSADDWLTSTQPTGLELHTQTLDGEPQPAEGILKVYRRPEPDRIPRTPLISLDPPTPVADTGRFSGDLGSPAFEKSFSTGTNGTTRLEFALEVGRYRAVLQTQDRFGRRVLAERLLQVIDPSAAHLALKVPILVEAPRWAVEPGEEFVAVWGTGYEAGRAFVEIELNDASRQRFWTEPGRTQQEIRVPVTEEMRGGFMLHVVQVRDNVAYAQSRTVAVPWSNKSFTLSWEHFTSKLEPGQKETWTAVIKRNAPGGRDLEAAVAEMVATLYDASLDPFASLNWPSLSGQFRSNNSWVQAHFSNQGGILQTFDVNWPNNLRLADLSYHAFLPEILGAVYGRGRQVARLALAGGAATNSMADAAEPVMLSAKAASPMTASAVFFAEGDRAGARGPEEANRAGGSRPAPNLGQVSARKNLNETAFFFPQLVSETNGTVRLSFTMPEALTQWRFLAFAHDRELRSGRLEAMAVTARELMVQPNPPRFLREGDELEFTVKISNQSDTPQQGNVRLSFTNVLSGTAADTALGVTQPELPFDVPSKESRTYAWRLRVPDGQGFLAYQAVAATARLSDGEAGNLPVLSRRVFVTESLPLPIRGPGARSFRFDHLAESGNSRTLQHQSLTVQMVSNPAWYAVLALPYLMEYPYECNEQTFNRYYANALARHIANHDPRIRTVFDQWRNTPALDSPLEKNQDLKSVALEETPWLRQAQAESQTRRNVGLLFDDARLGGELARALQQLQERQLPDGAWPWFAGGPADDFMTLYITTGFGRLRHLGVDALVQPALRALDRLDRWIDRVYQDLKKDQDLTKNHLNPTIAFFLYGRSFFLEDKPVGAEAREAVDYFLGQARTYWLQTDNRQTQGHLALALHRFGQPVPAQAILKSLKERAVTDAELGMFWRDPEPGWWWYHAPIETQALMIEAFDEVAGDVQSVEACKVWLLKQKQTQDWRTTKATGDAVYALLLRGSDLLTRDALVEVRLGDVDVTPRPADASSAAPAVEAGTGFYEKRFAAADITPKLADIRVSKADAGVAWGSVHWQYLEDLGQVKAYAGTPLKLTKTLFTKVNTARGPELRPATGALAVGDELVTRLELRVDRDMEYLHLKDQRGSGTEPVAVLSGYRYQDGLGYYETTRDTATHFFLQSLPRGTYVLEYSVRIQHRGRYPAGIAEIQCMYAPEFNSHSASPMLEVGP